MKKQTRKDINKNSEKTGRFYHGIEIKEATSPLRLFVNENDVKGADRKNPMACAVAKAAERSCDSKRVCILRSVAYVELRDENGDTHVERFFIPKPMSDKVKAFDKTGKFPPGGFTLMPMTPGRQLDAITRRNEEHPDRYKRSRKKKALIVGTRVKKQRTIIRDMEWRSGTGRIKFKKAK